MGLPRRSGSADCNLVVKENDLFVWIEKSEQTEKKQIKQRTTEYGVSNDAKSFNMCHELVFQGLIYYVYICYEDSEKNSV